VSSSFAALGVPADLVERLARRGITDPFPIQAATLPDALGGRDVSGRAPTGSGKTLAFGIPLVTRVERARPRRPRGLVLVPTRELAAQVHAELVALAGPKGPSALAVYGGVGFEKQVSALRRGADVVVACPGRLADLLSQRQLTLEDVGFVVIDEADRMADMGFLPEVRRLLDQVRSDRQTLLFSATLDGDVDVLVRRYQRSPVRHELAAEEGAAQSRHVFWRAERPERLALVADLVGKEWPAIVFCRTRHGADRLTRQLAKAGVSAAAIHGDRSQGQRERALAGLVSGKVQALVATDVAARGIHVDDVACVVHFDPPGDDKAYVHRSGRTGRAGAAGLVVSLVDPAQEAEARKLQRALGLPAGFDDRGSAGTTPRRTAAPASTPAPSADRPPRRRRRRGGGPRGRTPARR
jgi:superfamily II DNA/RNA helicase